jgi:hypothetical protein
MKLGMSKHLSAKFVAECGGDAGKLSDGILNNGDLFKSLQQLEKMRQGLIGNFEDSMGGADERTTLDFQKVLWELKKCSMYTSEFPFLVEDKYLFSWKNFELEKTRTNYQLNFK